MYSVRIKDGFGVADNLLLLALPRVTIDGGDAITVEIGGPISITCTGNSIFNDVTVSWIQIMGDEEKPGTPD